MSLNTDGWTLQKLLMCCDDLLGELYDEKVFSDEGFDAIDTRVIKKLKAAYCAERGHKVVKDHCDLPEHDSWIHDQGPDGLAMDEEIRKYERLALQGDSEALERLRILWARGATWQKCALCRKHIPGIGNSLEDHNQECPVVKKRDEEVKEARRKAREAQAAQLEFTTMPSGSRLHIIPLPPAYGGRPRKEPLVLQSRDGFRTIDESNIDYGVYIPDHQFFWWYAWSLLPALDAWQEHKEQLVDLYDHAKITFSLATTRLVTLPISVILRDPRTSDYPIEWLDPKSDVTISGRPFELRPQEAIQISIDREVSVPLTAVMYGIRLYPISG